MTQSDVQKNLLFIVYYFPPIGMGGVQRAAKFARYLPQFGWNPHIITVKDIHYYARDESLLEEVGDLAIERAGSLDPARVARVLGMGRSQGAGTAGGNWQATASGYLQKLLYPDSKRLWTPFAYRRIRSLLKRKSFQAIFSTSPPISAHRLAARLNLPWLADFRDYWTIDDGVFAPTEWHRSKYAAILREITRKASRIIAVSDPIAESIRQAAETETDKIITLPNGFDPADFAGVAPHRFDRFTLAYIGNLNARRSPECLFQALIKRVARQPDLKHKFQLFFVGSHFGLDLDDWLERLAGMVSFKPYVPHRESLSLAMGADALLLLLSPESAPGVMTGKVFEYLGLGKPILAIIPDHVAVYALLKDRPHCYLARPDRPEEIDLALERLIKEHMAAPRAKERIGPVPPELVTYTREEQTRQLAELLDEMI